MVVVTLTFSCSVYMSINLSFVQACFHSKPQEKLVKSAIFFSILSFHSSIVQAKSKPCNNIGHAIKKNQQPFLRYGNIKNNSFCVVIIRFLLDRDVCRLLFFFFKKCRLSLTNEHIRNFIWFMFWGSSEGLCMKNCGLYIS